MATNVKLHLLPGASRSSGVLITALLTKTQFTLVNHNAQTCKTDDYCKIHPFGKLPSAEVPEGPLYESNTIARYLARKANTLYGANSFENCLVDQWLDTIRMDFTNQSRFGYSIFGFADSFFKYDAKNLQHDMHEFIKTLKVVDGKLNGKSHLVGSSLTIADVTLVADLSVLYKHIFTEKERHQLPHLTAYFEKWAKTPEFRQVLGLITYPEHAWPVCITKSAHAEKPKEEKKKEEKKKEEKPKEEKKKEEKPKDDEDEVPQEKAKVYTFPDTTFDLYAFKTMYVNAPNKQDALDFLWKNWDPKGFSFWYLKYDKMPSEGKVAFLTSNLMNGYLDRAEACRKYTLGVHGVYGDEPNLEIRGLWLWRGTEMLEPLKEHLQFDVYFYTKLDPSKDEDKALITEYWTKLNEDVDKVEGRTARTVKYFK